MTLFFKLSDLSNPKSKHKENGFCLWSDKPDLILRLPINKRLKCVSEVAPVSLDLTSSYRSHSFVKFTVTEYYKWGFSTKFKGNFLQVAHSTAGEKQMEYEHLLSQFLSLISCTQLLLSMENTIEPQKY